MDRRDFLKIAAAGAALAACTPRHRAGGSTNAPPVPGSPSPTGADPLAAIRGFRVQPGTEPAFVFRALPPSERPR